MEKRIKIKREYFLEQLVMADIEQGRILSKDINFRKSKNTKEAMQVRILMAQTGHNDANSFLSLLIQSAFESFFESGSCHE